MRVREPAVGLVRGAGDAVEGEQRLDLRDLRGLDEGRLEPEPGRRATLSREASTSASGTGRR